MPEFLKNFSEELIRSYFNVINKEIWEKWLQVRGNDESCLRNVSEGILAKYEFDFSKDLSAIKPYLKSHIRTALFGCQKNGLTQREKEVVLHLLEMQRRKTLPYLITNHTRDLFLNKREEISKAFPDFSFEFFGF